MDGSTGRGRPKKTFSREQVDEAKRLLGRRQYPSKVAGLLRAKFDGLTLARAYKLIEAAQTEVYEQFKSQGADPLASTFLFLQSVIAAPKEKTSCKVAAANAIIKLFGMEKIARALQGADEVGDFIAGVMAKRAARAGEPKAEPKPTQEPEGAERVE